MCLLDQAADVMADDLTQYLIDHRNVGLAADVIAEFGLDH